MSSFMPTARVRSRMGQVISASVVAIALIIAACFGVTAHAQRTPGEKIIVSGASGQLGGLVIQELLARGVPAADLILVSRTPETLAQYASRGASVRFGDFNQPESLPAAFKGGTRILIISISGGTGPRAEAHGRAINAAKAAGVKHIAYTSWIGLSRGDASGIGADHQQTEDLIKASGVAWTMLRNSLYADSLLEQAAQMAKTGTATAAPNATGVGYVTRQDCAAAAAAVLTTPGHEGKAYDITGPALVGTRELAAIVTRVTGRAVQVTAPDPAAATGRGGRGGGFGGPSVAIVSTHVADLTGRPATTVQQLLEANRAALSGQP